LKDMHAVQEHSRSIVSMFGDSLNVRLAQCTSETAQSSGQNLAQMDMGHQQDTYNGIRANSVRHGEPPQGKLGHFAASERRPSRAGSEQA
jgi:hypothetical protein